MDHRIVILGFMGCGKTTVAAELARRLESNFVDLDQFISTREGRSPAEIINQDSEDHFREVETLALRDVLQDQGARVIALGGGTWITPANRTLLALYDCVTVWLDAPFYLCWMRIISGEPNRPLAPDRATASARFESRRADYALANRRIAVTEADSVARLAEQIVREI